MHTSPSCTESSSHPHCFPTPSDDTHHLATTATRCSSLTNHPPHTRPPPKPDPQPPPYYAKALVLPSPCENILTESCFSVNGFIPIFTPVPYILCPDGTILRIHRSPVDHRPFIHGHIIRPADSHAFLGLGYGSDSGAPVTFLLDSGAGIIIVNSDLSDILLNRSPGSPIQVVGDSLVTPLGGGTLPFRFLPAALSHPILTAFYGPSTHGGLGTPTAALSDHPTPAPPVPLPVAISALRQCSGALWRTPLDVCTTLNIWSPADLALYPTKVHGVSDYYVNPDQDHGRDSIFYRAAAARPGLSRTRNAASTAKATAAAPAPGEWWDMDISPPYPFDPEGNCRTFFFFERRSAHRMLAFRPSKSAEDFLASVD